MKLRYERQGSVLTIGKNMGGGLLIETTNKDNKFEKLFVIEREDIGKMMELLEVLVKPDIDNYVPERWSVVK